MGTSTALNYKTGRWVLDCGQCGGIGKVRKRSCPAGYCPPVQMCPDCYKAARASGQWAEWHAECAGRSAEYHARQAAMDAEPGRWPRGAWGTWHTKTADVLVRTRAGNWLLVPKDNYNPNEPLDTQGAVPWTPDTGIPLP